MPIALVVTEWYGNSYWSMCKNFLRKAFSVHTKTNTMSTIIRFRINCEVPQGQSLVIFGNLAELGNSIADEGLRTYPQNGNIWRRSVMIQSTLSTFVFQYAFLNRNSGKIIKEEIDQYCVDIPIQNTKSNDNNTSNAADTKVLIIRITHSIPNQAKLPQVQFSNTADLKGVAIVVLGKRLLPSGQATELLKDRVRDSIALYYQLLAKYSPEHIIIVMSGGQVQKGTKVPPEAKLMLHLALQYVRPSSPSPQILMEDESLNTIQNALNSKDILEDTGIKELYLITTEFHMERSTKIFTTVLGPGYKIHPCPSQTKLPQKELDKEMSVETRAIANLKDRFWSLFRIQIQDSPTQDIPHNNIAAPNRNLPSTSA